MTAFAFFTLSFFEFMNVIWITSSSPSLYYFFVLNFFQHLFHSLLFLFCVGNSPMEHAEFIVRKSTTTFCTWFIAFQYLHMAYYVCLILLNSYINWPRLNLTWKFQHYGNNINLCSQLKASRTRTVVVYVRAKSLLPLFSRSILWLNGSKWAKCFI